MRFTLEPYDTHRMRERRREGAYRVTVAADARARRSFWRAYCASYALAVVAVLIIAAAFAEAL